MKNPCKGCEDSIDGRCRHVDYCTKLIEWQVEVAWRIEHEREADPQVERGLDYMIDDREV